MKLREAISKLRVWGVAGAVAYVLRGVQEACVRRRLAALARKSVGTVPRRGVTVVGELTGQVSLSKTLRDFVLLLREAGIPCQTFDTNLRSAIPDADIVTAPQDFNLRKYDHLVMMYRAPLDLSQLPELHTARIVFHESEHGLERTAPYLWDGRSDIIAMSDFNFDYYRRIFTGQPVFKLTYPLRPVQSGATPRQELRRKMGIGAEDFVVFFNFDFGSYYRKNVTAAVRAFAKAFGDVKNVRLVFKTKGAAKNPRQAKEMERLVDELGLRDRFLHITAYLPRADVDGLTAACDVYLSLHRGEGFGLGMAEAMLQARPVVATDWSSNVEFCSRETACPVPFRLVPIKSHEYMPEMREWAEADVEAAAVALRRLYDDPTLREDMGRKAKAFVEDHFSIENFKADVSHWLDGTPA